MASTDLRAADVGRYAPPRLRDVTLRLPTPLTAVGSRSVALNWVISRAITMTLMVTIASSVTGDVNYYARSLHALFHGSSIRETLQEYPLPVLTILVPQYLIAGMNPVAFAILFAFSMLAVDAAFTTLLWKVSLRRRTEAVRLWLWFVPAVGPMAYFRFDLVPAALAGAAVLAAVRRPALTGAFTAVGAALKLWPAVMLPIFLIRRGDRRRVLTGFLSTGIVVAGASLIIGGGFGRLLSPLTWQSARGLQIESVPATPLMVLRSFHSHSIWQLRISRYKAWEIFGWGTHFMLLLSTLATAAGLVLLAVLWWRANTHPKASAETLGWLLVLTSVVVTVTNKTLSPQYILWLGGPLCALMARARADDALRRAGRLLIVISLLTQIIYPVIYPELTNRNWPLPFVTFVLLARNVLLVRLGWIACREVWQLSRMPEVEGAEPDSVDATDPATAVAAGTDQDALAAPAGAPAARAIQPSASG